MTGPVIRVIGVGNGGTNAVAQILRADVAGVEVFAMDTDVRKLRDCPVPNRVAIGHDVTQGLGCGADPDMGLRAAQSSQKEIEHVIAGAHMVFVTAAMGGGTGTGAAPVICKLAKEMGALTVAVCTKPFRFERQRRMNTAMLGIEQVAENVDALIVIDNQRLFEQVDKHTRLTDAFAMVDDVLRQAVQGVSDLITIAGTINVDFADVCAVLKDAGPVLMGMSEAPAEAPSSDVVNRAVASPLLENGIVGATNILLNVTVGPDTSLWQVHDIADAVAAATQTDMPSVIFGTVVDESLRGKIKLTILAANFVTPQAPSRPSGDLYGSSRPLYNNPPSPQRRPASSPPPVASPLPSTERPSIPGLPSVPPPASGGSSDLDMPTFVRRNLERREGS